MIYEIKRKAEDFIVEEITPKGRVIEVGKDWEFEGGCGKYTICVLEKINWETHLAIKRVAKALRISWKRIGFAGTKDKRSWSAQRISLYNVDPQRIKEIKLDRIKVFPIAFSNNPIKLGDLWGNRFTIKVYTDMPLRKIKSRFPNKFGPQRFGEIRPITHLVGEQIVKGDFERAVKIYIGYVCERESEESKEARKRLAKDWDYKKALKYFPRHLKFERAMLDHLSKHPNDYVNALRKLPKPLRLLLVQAYQAQLFNEFVDFVIKNKIDVKEGPLYGYEMELSPLEREFLQKKGLKQQDFFIKSMPEMAFRGKRREIWAEAKDFRIMEEGEDDHGHFYWIRFSLPKGCYATVFLKWLFEGKV